MSQGYLTSAPFLYIMVLEIKTTMKFQAVLVAGLIAAPLPVIAQQTNVYQVCTNYQENYAPGYYDRYGNYVQGNVNTQRYNVDCQNQTYYRPNGGYIQQSPVVAPIPQPGYGYRRGYCSPARTTLGGLLGGGAAAAIAKQDAWSWAIPLGAVLGSGMAQAGCY